MQWAINKWSIPVPKDPNLPFVPVFSPEEWAPFAGMSSTFNKSSGSVDIGFAVDDWRPTHFIQTYKDANNQLIGNVFAGVDVDVAVINSNSNLQGESYHITPLGKIAFTPNPIT